MPQRIVVVGAGPMGLAAAIAACDRGHEVTVLERGRPGDSLREWGPTRFFTPLSMNVTPRMLEILGGDAPPSSAMLTGPEMADFVLQPLVNREPLRGRVLAQHEVVAIGRRGLTRGDYARHPIRAERPFRLLVATAEGERTIEAEVVLDATGGYAVPNPAGAGGIPAVGERSLRRPLIRKLGELHARAGELRDRHVLLIGNGHSAANAIAVLEASGARVTWAVRSPNLRPVTAIANDPLPERQSVVDRANALAAAPPPFLTVERRAMIEAIREENGRFAVTLSGGRSCVVDEILAFTGYRPEGGMLAELAIDTSPVTEGGGRLYRAISNITDCLTVPGVRAADVESGEPGFFFVGSRAYGRAPTFLLQTGLAQLDAIFSAIG